MQHNQDGSAAVVGGVLTVTPPEGTGRPAVIRCEDGVVLSEDGRSAHVADVAPQLTVHVEVARDELLATVSVERAPGARYRLADQPAGPSILIRKTLAERIPCPEPTLGDLYAALTAHGVVDGIDHDALQRLARGEFGTLPVARGTSRIPPEHARVQVLQVVDASGDRYVRAGTELARIEAAKPGTPGHTVTGRPLPVEEPRAPDLGFGEGVAIELGGSVVATTDGHAHIVDGVLSVAPALRLPAIQGRDGEVSSPGSIEVTGSIEDGALVRARRSIAVGEFVRHATLDAGFSIRIAGGAFDAALRAGHTIAALARLTELVAPLAHDVARVEAGVEQLVAASENAGRSLHPVRALGMVLERIAPELEPNIRRALAEADRERGTVPHDVLTALRGAHVDFDAMRSGKYPVDGLGAIGQTFAREADRLHQLTAVPAEVRAGLLQKCELDVVGAVVVTGKGVIDSTVAVLGSIEVLSPDAIFRGGRLRLDGTGEITELAPGAGGLEVDLAPGSTLEARTIQPGVILNLPDETRRVSRLITEARITADPLAA